MKPHLHRTRPSTSGGAGTRPTRRRRHFTLGVVVLVIALVASACSFTSDDPQSADGGDGGADGASSSEQRGAGVQLDTNNLNIENIVFKAEHIETVDSCDVLLDRIKDEALERVGPWGFGGNHFRPRRASFDGEDTESEDSDAAETTSAASDFAASGSDAPSSDVAGGLEQAARVDTEVAVTDEGNNDTGAKEASETNRQEQEVDEADLVKTDGRRLVAVFGQHMNVIDVTGDTPELVHSIKLPDDAWDGEIFLDGDTALLMSSGWTEQPFLASTVAGDADLSWYPGSPTGRLLEVDLDSGEVGRTLEFEGNYLSAREIDGTIRIVLSATADRFSFVFPSNQGAEEGAEKANRAIIEESTIDHWIPTYRLTEGGEEVASGRIVDCRRVHLPTEFAGFGSVVLLTANLDTGLTIDDSLSVFTEARTVYASTSRLAVAAPRLPDFELAPPPEPAATSEEATTIEPAPVDTDFATTIHTFDITDPQLATYVASGQVRGHLLNQYSLSEFGGYLRVATTDGSPWEPQDQSESFVTVMAEDGQELKATGQVGELGKGEQIFAVRFLGTTAYVVTFRQIDPLYTVDLSDPTNPRVLGELKMPGFSSYLHPINDTLLLGVGTDGDESGRTDGAVASLFDVSNLTDPQLISQLPLGPGINAQELGDGSSFSPVSHDARAFTYWDETGIIPVSWWSYSEEQGESNGSAAVLVQVEDESRLVERGRVVHDPITQCYSPSDDRPILLESGETRPEGSECWSYTPEVFRSVVIGDQLFTLSHAGVQVSDWNDLTPQTWIPFPFDEF